VGGEEKKNSSSWILEQWKYPKTNRQWGYYRVLHEVPGCKVKELTVEPGQKLSMQKHANRSEFWFVSEGTAILNSGDSVPPVRIDKHSYVKIEKDMWHQLHNPYDVPCKLVEIQYGTECNEDDIERK
jgi:mannose-6-phosphate isomerase-like protein (cupin superfamily)